MGSRVWRKRRAGAAPNWCHPCNTVMSRNTVIKGTKYPQDADDAHGQGEESVLWIGHDMSRAKVPVHAFLVLTVTTMSEGLGRLSSRSYVTETTVSSNGDGECLSADRNRVYQAHPVNSAKKKNRTPNNHILKHFNETSSFWPRGFLLLRVFFFPCSAQLLLIHRCQLSGHRLREAPCDWHNLYKAFAPRLANPSTVFSSPLDSDSSCHYLQWSIYVVSFYLVSVLPTGSKSQQVRANSLS